MAVQFETTFILEEGDYTALMLYTASKDKSYRTRLAVVSGIIVLLMLFLIINAGIKNSNLGMLYFIILAPIAILGHFWIKTSNKRYLVKRAKETYKNNFGRETTIIISDDLIKRVDNTGDSSFKISQIQEVIETGQHIFIQMLSGQWYAFPKAKIPNLQDLQTVISQIVKNPGVKNTVELNWKW
jgi:hypothetical protein